MRRSLGAGGPHPFETLDFILFLFSPTRWSADATFLIKRKWPKIDRGRGGPRRRTISFALRAAEIEIPPGGQGGTWGDWSPREGRLAPKGRAFRRRPSAPGGSGLARHWFHGRFQASALPLVKLWAVLRSEGLPEGPGSLGGQGPAATDVSSVEGKKSLCAAQLGIQKAFSHTLPRGAGSAQIPPRTAGGLG